MKTQEILAIPSLCDSTDFGLSKYSFNSQTLNDLKKRTSLEELAKLTDNLRLYHFGSPEQGGYFVENISKGEIVYYMKYKKFDKKLVGVPSVTQTAVWQSLTGGLISGFAKLFVFTHLLKEYPAILSDKLQTERGRDFWIRLMDQALEKGYKVGLVDFNGQKVHLIPDENSLSQWYRLDEGAWSWHSNKHQGLRFVIYKG